MPKDHLANTNPLAMEETALQQREREIYSDGPLTTSPRRPTLKSTFDGQLVFGKVHLTNVGLQVSGDPTEDEWLALGGILKRVNNSIQWLIGDWVVGCQNVWTDTYEQVIEQTGFRYNTVKNLAYIARNVPLSVRTDKLKFGIYMLIAPLKLEDGTPDIDRQQYWVNRAVNEGLSKSKLRVAMGTNPPALSQNVLGDKQNRRRMNKIWRNINNIDAISLDDIDALRKWLDTLEHMKRG